MKISISAKELARILDKLDVYSDKIKSLRMEIANLKRDVSFFKEEAIKCGSTAVMTKEASTLLFRALEKDMYCPDNRVFGMSQMLDTKEQVEHTIIKGPNL